MIYYARPLRLPSDWYDKIDDMLRLYGVKASYSVVSRTESRIYRVAPEEIKKLPGGEQM